MSGLLERIARRRRASASRRLGPPTSRNGAAPSWNGAGPRAESSPVADESPVAAIDEGAHVEGAGALAIPTEETPVAEGPEEVPGEMAPPVGAAEAPSEMAPPVGAAEAPGEMASPAGSAEEAATQPTEDASPAPVEPAEEPPPAGAAEEPTDVQAPIAETAPAAEEAPAAPPQPPPEPTEPSPAPVEPPAAPPEPSPGEPKPAEPPPVEPTPDEPSPPAAPTFLGRGQVRRRARYLRRLREVQLRDIGGFVLELYRSGRDQPDLLQAKLQVATSTERELRALERALREQLPIAELRQAGIGGACSNCGAVYGSADRYCASCGNPLSRRT